MRQNCAGEGNYNQSDVLHKCTCRYHTNEISKTKWAESCANSLPRIPSLTQPGRPNEMTDSCPAQLLASEARYQDIETGFNVVPPRSPSQSPLPLAVPVALGLSFAGTGLDASSVIVNDAGSSKITYSSGWDIGQSLHELLQSAQPCRRNCKDLV